MKRTEQIELPLKIPKLEDLFPIGMFNKDISFDAGNAERAFGVLEKLITDSALKNALLSRYALLQIFPRMHSERNDGSQTFETLHENIPNYLSNYTESLCPTWFKDFINTLAEDQAEVFLKNYLHGHETWGHPEGIATLVRTMLESSCQNSVNVVVKQLEFEERQIPEIWQSHLGNKEKRSVLGSDFILGKGYRSRPRFYSIEVGPINLRTLEKFHRSGWATETNASKKLYRLVEFAEPFYLHARIHFILEKIGFILAHSTLGKDKLGLVESEFAEDVKPLLAN